MGAVRRTSPLLRVALLLLPAACAAPASDVPEVEEAPLEQARPADGELPPAPDATCGASVDAARPLRVFELAPRTRATALGRGIEGGTPSAATWALGTPVREASNIVAQATAAGPDLLNLGGWVGAPSPFLDSTSTFVDESPLARWGELNRSTETRIGFAIAWHQIEDEWSLEDRARATSAPADPGARYVAGLAAHRYLGITFAFDLSSCAARDLAGVLGEAPVIQRTRPGVDPVASTLLDPARRDAIASILVRSGAAPYVSVVSNRARPDVARAIRASRCSASDLGACARLLDDLRSASRAIATAPPPSTYDDLVAGASDWSVTRVRTEKLAFVP